MVQPLLRVERVPRWKCRWSWSWTTSGFRNIPSGDVDGALEEATDIRRFARYGREMSEDTSPGIVDKLPGRPLTTAEGDALDAQESERAWVRPESVLVLEDREVVVALGAVNRERGTMHLLGYSPDDESWVVVDRWDEVDLGHEAFYERLETWEAQTFAGRPEFELG